MSILLSGSSACHSLYSFDVQSCCLSLSNSLSLSLSLSTLSPSLILFTDFTLIPPPLEAPGFAKIGNNVAAALRNRDQTKDVPPDNQNGFPCFPTTTSAVSGAASNPTVSDTLPRRGQYFLHRFNNI